MNDQDWYTWWDAFDLLSWCEDEENDLRLPPRKLRLFAAACCRTIWSLLPQELNRRAVEVAEAFADHESSLEVLRTIRRAAEEARRTAEPAAFGAAPGREAELAYYSALLAERMTQEDFVYNYMAQDVADAVIVEAIRASTPSLLWGTVDGDAIAERVGGERGEIECGLVREIFPNPLRPISVDSSWLEWNGGAAVAIAQQIYDNRAFHLMPVLADALEDAGCESEEILTHCRGPGPHTLGCWVVDLLLEKS